MKVGELLRAAPVVVALIILQAVILLASLDDYFAISIFCTGSKASWLSWVFGVLHLMFLGLLALGLVSLAWRPVRPFYLVLTIAGFAALPLQAALVHSDVLTCDLP